MRYKHFKNAGIDVSEMAVGTWAIGGKGLGVVDDNDSIAAIRAMLEGGVNLIDTAPGYGVGHSEEVVGRAIKGYDRSKFMISTKFGAGPTTLNYAHTQDKANRDGTRQNVFYELEQSLKRLDTDYIDFYFMHWPDYKVTAQETMDALNEAKKKGMIRYIGLSNHPRERIEEMMRFGRIDAIQPPYSMVVRRDEDLMKWAREQGIDTFTYGSLGAGILTGKYRTAPKFEEGDYRGRFYPFFNEPYFSKVLKVLEVMDKVSAECDGRPLSQIALNWSLKKDYVSTALVGVKNTVQAAENLKTFEWELSDEHEKMIDEAIAQYLDFDGASDKK